MNCTRIAALILVWGTTAATCPWLTGADMTDRKQIRAATVDVEEARDKLKGVTRQYDDAQKEVAKAETSRKHVLERLESLRDEMERKHADYSRLATARREQQSAQAAFDDASRPILKLLRADKKFQDAVWDAKIARNRLADLKHEKTADAEEQQKLVDSLKHAAALPGQLEQDAIAGDIEASAAQTAADRAFVRLTVASKRMEQDFEKDPEFRKAVRNAEAAEMIVAHAKEQLANKQSQVYLAKRNLAREENQLVQTKLRHQIDSERDRRRKRTETKK